jgi:hypothetical protein
VDYAAAFSKSTSALPIFTPQPDLGCINPSPPSRADRCRLVVSMLSSWGCQLGLRVYSTTLKTGVHGVGYHGGFKGLGASQLLSGRLKQSDMVQTRSSTSTFPIAIAHTHLSWWPVPPTTYCLLASTRAAKSLPCTIASESQRGLTSCRAYLLAQEL